MKLELYYYPECPFCQIVLKKIDTLLNKPEIKLKHINQDTTALNFHIKQTGRRTVPCLYIDDKPMFESRDIARWLDSNFNKGR
ncbi:MAG: glutathione S-transferase N-terminal domain-containing protein [Bacteriovoracaceae bacterium]|nr:glutathione S-transferase N-terminal domain-containing protein [Bacteriovoracaceae bacterium]